jgi:hypothetical protein
MAVDAAPSPGDIGLVRISGSVGAGIRFGQWLDGDGFEDFEHAFGVVGDGQIVEAEVGGARLAGLEEYAGLPVVWLRCPVPLQGPVAAAYRELLGRPYSFADYAALAAHRLRVPVPGLRGYIQDTGHVICSQLVDEGARRGGWTLFDDGRWPGYVTPGSLYKLAEESKEVGSP